MEYNVGDEILILPGTKFLSVFEGGICTIIGFRENGRLIRISTNSKYRTLVLTKKYITKVTPLAKVLYK